MIPSGSHTQVYLAIGSTDMRKEIDGLSILVEGVLSLDSFSGHLFVFCNRRRTKVLYWDRNGFALYQKRLERNRFRWPETRETVMEIGPRDLSFLLDGLDFTASPPSTPYPPTSDTILLTTFRPFVYLRFARRLPGIHVLAEGCVHKASKHAAGYVAQDAGG